MGTQDVENGRLASSVLSCIESLCNQNAAEYRRIRREIKKSEDPAVQQKLPQESEAEQPAKEEPSMQLPQQIVSQLDVLNQKLAAANLEIRRYETRVFAYERAVYALRKENAELLELCKQAREGKPLPPEPQPQEPVLDKPGLPVVRFTPQGEKCLETPEDDSKPFFDEVRPPHPKPFLKPRTPLEHLSVQLLEQFDQMMGT